MYGAPVPRQMPQQGMWGQIAAQQKMAGGAAPTPAPASPHPQTTQMPRVMQAQMPGGSVAPGAQQQQQMAQQMMQQKAAMAKPGMMAQQQPLQNMDQLRQRISAFGR